MAENFTSFYGKAILKQKKFISLVRLKICDGEGNNLPKLEKSEKCFCWIKNGFSRLRYSFLFFSYYLVVILNCKIFIIYFLENSSRKEICIFQQYLFWCSLSKYTNILIFLLCDFRVTLYILVFIPISIQIWASNWNDLR